MPAGVVGCVLTVLTPSSLSLAILAATWPGSSWSWCWWPGEGEKGVGWGVPGTEQLAIPSSPPSVARLSRSSGCRLAGLGVGAGVAGVDRALSARSLERLAASWSGLGARWPEPDLAGVGAGVPGTAGDLTELVELVLLLILLSIPGQPAGDTLI